MAALASQAPASARTFVIVHGAWGGGWDWRPVSDLLTAHGHRAFRVTLTGLGERVHLATPEVGLETHITDVVNAILYEDLRDVTLVGHSYGGMVITGVADRIPDRLARVVYVDAFLPEDGESLTGLWARTGEPLVVARGPYIVPDWVKPGTAPPSDVPHPAKTFSDSIVLKNPKRLGVSATYILTVDPGATTDPFDPFAARAKAKGWPVERLSADHNAQHAARAELCTLLERAR
jgi:pimeloyl-ACP methyl ester carboxylesterase